MMLATILGMFVLSFGLFGLLATVFWVWMLVDCIKNTRLSDNERVVWVLVIIFLYVLGAFIYLLAGRK